LRYEENRLRQHTPESRVFEPTSDAAGAYVFDVSTPEAIEVARTASPMFADVFAYLLEHGLNAAHPGFDILTVDPAGVGQPDRLIELKSSGVKATFQTMTWNEWKTARGSRLRNSFYLYLVGNLRSDLVGVQPFVRTIQDPFGTLLAEEQEEVRVTRSVRLDLRQFKEAEHLDLKVQRST
jgi:hypothetical protein